MYVTKISLRNIRGFKALDFDLDRGDGAYAGWTVFTGPNGSGKSTLLKAIALGLSGLGMVAALQPNLPSWNRDKVDLDNFSILIRGKLVENDDFEISKEHEIIDIERVIGLFEFGGTVSIKLMETIINDENRRGHGLHKNQDIDWRKKHNIYHSFFFCGYGPFRRIFGSAPEIAQQMSAPITERFVTLFNEAASLAEVDQWMRLLKHKELEGKTAEKAQLDLLLEILRDDLMPDGMTIDGVDSDGLWLRDRNGIRLSWGEMSDGYRSALALLADILRHLIKFYGIEGLAERGADGKLFITRSGVVLIDEVDAHLHPAWQQEIGFWLKRHFPKIQFLVTSHSPLICQAADKNGLFVLPDPGGDDEPFALSQEDYRKVIASRPDTILLSPAFGLENTRSPRAVAARGDYARLQAKKRGGGKLTKEERKREGETRSFVQDEED